MKKLLYALTVSLMALVMSAAAACTNGGNINDDNSSSMPAGSKISGTSSDGSSHGTMSNVVSDVESDLGVSHPSSVTSGSSAAGSQTAESK